MNPSLSTLTAQPRPLTLRVGGEERTYLVHPLTIDDLGRLQGWIDAQFPDPFKVAGDAIARGDYTVAQQQYLMDRAMARASEPAHLIGSSEADRVLFSMPGTCELLKLAIRKGGVPFPDEEAQQVFMHLRLADLAAIHAQTGIDAVASDPKAPGGTSGGSGSSTSPARRRRRGSTSGAPTTAP